MTTVYIVSFYANITKIGTRSYHCIFTRGGGGGAKAAMSNVAICARYGTWELDLNVEIEFL